MKKSDSVVPRHLSPEARRLWARLSRDFHLEDGAAIALLRAVCESFDRTQDARRLLRKEGAVIRDRFGAAKAHPAAAIERDARGQMIAALRALRLAPEEIP